MVHRTVMLVDPRDDQRQVCSDALYAEGFRVVECREARLALTLAARGRPIAIVAAVDGACPEHGWAVIAELRRAVQTRYVPIIAVGDPFVLERFGGSEAPLADAHLPLPLSPSALVDTVRRVALRPRGGRLRPHHG